MFQHVLQHPVCVPSWLQASVPFVEVLVHHSADVEYLCSPEFIFVLVINMFAVLIQVCSCIQQHIATATLFS